MQVCGPPASNQSPATNIIGNIDEIWEMEAALEQEKEAEEGDRRRAEEEEKNWQDLEEYREREFRQQQQCEIQAYTEDCDAVRQNSMGPSPLFQAAANSGLISYVRPTQAETHSQPDFSDDQAFADITNGRNRNKVKSNNLFKGAKTIKTPASAKMKAVNQRHRNQAARNSAFYVNQVVTNTT